MPGSFKPPDSFDFTSPDQWPAWRERFKRYRLASALHKEDEEIQVSALVYSMGPEAESVLQSFGGEANTFTAVIQKLDEYFIPKRNFIAERQSFEQRNQAGWESNEQYIRALFSQADKCDFTDKQERLRDRLLAGMRDKELSKKIQLKALEESVTLDTVIQMLRNTDIIEGNRSATDQPASVQRVFQAHNQNRFQKHNKGHNQARKNQGKYRASQSRTNTAPSMICKYCGRERHDTPAECPARGRTCAKCGKRDHFAAVCLSKTTGHVTETRASRSTERSEGTQIPGRSRKRRHIGLASPTSRWRRAVHLQSRERCWCKRHHSPPIRRVQESRATRASRPKATECRACPQHWRHVQSWCRLRRDTAEAADFLRDRHKREPAVARNLFQTGDPEIRWWRYAWRIRRHWSDEDAAGEVGSVRGRHTTSCDVSQENPDPSHEASGRRASSAGGSRHHQDCHMPNRMVLSDGTCPESWEQSKNSGWLQALEQSSEEGNISHTDARTAHIKTQRSNAILEAGRSVWVLSDLPLDEESSLLTTFITPFGRKAFLRLPMGLNMAPECFQRKMEETLKDLPGVICYMDDILCFGDETSHDVRLKAVMEHIQESGLKLNQAKCVLRQTSVIFLGMKVSKDGLQVDPEKLEAVRSLKAPTNTKQLRSLLGVINHLGRFVPHVQEALKPLNDLLKANRAWVWSHPQESALSAVKQLLTEAPVLAFFDPAKETIVSADASSFGIGGCILQRHGTSLKPVAFCSRTLTDTETRYAQIEKELLGATWTCEKFHMFLSGLPGFRLELDHKPLIPLINSKNLEDAPLRCQRMLMRLMHYNGTAVYVPGKEHIIPDYLSRNPQKLPEDDIGEIIQQEVFEYCTSVLSDLPASTKKLEEICKRQQDDELLRELAEQIQNGCLLKQTPLEARALWRQRQNQWEAEQHRRWPPPWWLRISFDLPSQLSAAAATQLNRPALLLVSLEAEGCLDEQCEALASSLQGRCSGSASRECLEDITNSSRLRKHSKMYKMGRQWYSELLNSFWTCCSLTVT